MNRRGFIGALTGIPIAAVAQPRITLPEISAQPQPSVVVLPAPQVNITIHARALSARDRDTLANVIGDSVTRTLHAGRARFK